MSDWLLVALQKEDFQLLREDFPEEGGIWLDPIGRHLEKRKKIHIRVEVDFFFFSCKVVIQKNIRHHS